MVIIVKIVKSVILYLILVNLHIYLSWGFISSHCGDRLTALNGMITSPNYPNNYGNGLDCTWTIELPNNYKIMIIFKSFHTEKYPHCDQVEVYDNNRYNRYNRHRSHCGNTIPDIFTSYQNVAYIKFTTDSQNVDKGFNIEYYGIVQSCPSGYEPDSEKRNCIDLDECEELNGACSGHKCININGSYSCSCQTSYALSFHENIKTCDYVDNNKSSIIMSATDTINQILFQDSVVPPIIKQVNLIYSGIEYSNSIDYCLDENYIAWINSKMHQIEIAPINHSEPSLAYKSSIITIKNLPEPISLSVDWVHNLIYWIELSSSTINVAKITDPAKHYIVIHLEDTLPQKIIVNVKQNSLIWNHIGFKPRIFHSKQDGSNQTVLYKTSKQVYYLTIDIEVSRYYFIDINTLILYSINSDGFDEREIFKSENYFKDVLNINIFNDRLYVTNGRIIFSTNKFKFKANSYQLIANAIKTTNYDNNIINRKQIYNFKIIDPILQPMLTNRCSSAKCSHLCLPSDENKIFNCICPENYLLINNTVCVKKTIDKVKEKSINWETDMQTLIDNSIHKRKSLQKLLNISNIERNDLNIFSEIKTKEWMEMKESIDLISYLNRKLSLETDLKYSNNGELALLILIFFGLIIITLMMLFIGIKLGFFGLKINFRRHKMSKENSSDREAIEI